MYVYGGPVDLSTQTDDTPPKSHDVQLPNAAAATAAEEATGLFLHSKLPGRKLPPRKHLQAQKIDSVHLR